MKFRVWYKLGSMLDLHIESEQVLSVYATVTIEADDFTKAKQYAIERFKQYPIFHIGPDLGEWIEKE